MADERALQFLGLLFGFVAACVVAVATISTINGINSASTPVPAAADAV